jgi:hypothetical protein
MIEQYLLNNNEKHYSAILPNFSELNRPQESWEAHKRNWDCSSLELQGEVFFLFLTVAFFR